MNNTVPGDSSVTYTDITADIDISSACTALHDPVETGTANLILELSEGVVDGLEHQMDCVPNNNKFVTTVNVDCGAGRSGLVELRRGSTLRLYSCIRFCYIHWSTHCRKHRQHLIKLHMEVTMYFIFVVLSFGYYILTRFT